LITIEYHSALLKKQVGAPSAMMQTEKELLVMFTKKFTSVEKMPVLPNEEVLVLYNPVTNIH
jgi:hypothetical protein